MRIGPISEMIVAKPTLGQRCWTVLLLTAKQLDVIPDTFALLVSGNHFLKSLEIRTPENTP